MILENLRDLCDTLISCENEAKLESGNEIMKDMDEDHYVQLLSDVIFGRLFFLLIDLLYTNKVIFKSSTSIALTNNQVINYNNIKAFLWYITINLI